MDGAQPIAADVLRFLDRYVDSVDQLEILLLLRGDRTRSWSPAQVSAELRSNADAAATRLDTMCTQELLVSSPDGSYHYGPSQPDMDRVIGSLEEAYRNYRLRVIERIFSKPDGLSAFADAFRFRKGP